MDYQSVSSRTIDSIGFDSDTQTLAVQFRNGSEYHYYNVAAAVFEGFLAASSPGQYLDLYVKKPGYSYAKVR